MIDYESLEDEYEGLPKSSKMTAARPEPINSHADMLKRVEGARNRLRKHSV
jgi:hypothetical protein